MNNHLNNLQTIIHLFQATCRKKFQVRQKQLHNHLYQNSRKYNANGNGNGNGNGNANGNVNTNEPQRPYPPRREANFNIEFDGVINAEGVLGNDA